MTGYAFRIAAAVCVLLAPVVFAAGIAIAQVGAAPSIERRLTKPGGPPSFEITPEERILTGKDDLVILKRREFFTLNASLTPRYSSNVFLTHAKRESDVVLNGAAILRAETVIDQRFAVFADAGYSLARHGFFTQLDYDNFSAGFGGSMSSGKWTYSASYRLHYVTQPGLDDHIVTQNNITGSVSYGLPINKDTAVFAFISLWRIWADPGGFTNVSAFPGLNVVRRISSDLVLSVGVQLSGRVYDDFFEAATRETRKDFGQTVTMGLRWMPRANITVLGNIGLSRVNSTIDSVDYEEFSATPTVTAQIKF